jgi:hypothetical protein
MLLSPCHNDKVALGQLDGRRSAFDIKPASTLNDDMEYGAISLHAKTPGRAALRQNHGYSQTDFRQDLVKDRSTPRIDGRNRRQVSRHDRARAAHQSFTTSPLFRMMPAEN